MESMLKTYAEKVTKMIGQQLEDEEITVFCEEGKNKLLENDFSLQIRFYGKEIGMCMWMREYFLADISVEDAANHICKEYYKAREQMLRNDGPVIPFNIHSFEAAKDHIYPAVYKAGTRDGVYKSLFNTDLGIYARVMFTTSLTEEGSASVLITNSILECWDVEYEYVLAVAYSNLEKNRKPFIMDMSKYYHSGNMEAEVFKPFDVLADGMLYVLSYGKYRIHDTACGASVVCSPDLLLKVATSFDGDFFILPASTEEIIVLKDNGFFEVEFLQDVVKEVNSTMVATLDKLSDGVYKYSDGQIIQVA